MSNMLTGSLGFLDPILGRCLARKHIRRVQYAYASYNMLSVAYAWIEKP